MTMSKRGGKRPGAGRPCVDLPNPIGIRLSDESFEILSHISKDLNMSKSKIVDILIKENLS